MIPRKDSSIERGIKILLDMLAFFLAANLSFDLRYYVEWGIVGRFLKEGPAPWAALYHAMPYLLLGWVIIFSLFGLYEPRLSRREEIHRIFKAQITAVVIMFATTFFYRGFSFSRGAALFLVPISLALTITFRTVFYYVKIRLAHWRSMRERLLVVGWTKETNELLARLRAPDNHYDLGGILSTAGQPLPDGVQRLGEVGELGRLLTREQFDRVVLIRGDLNRGQLQSAIECCLRHRVAWAVLPDLFELFLDRLRLDDLVGFPVIGPSGSNIVGLNRAIKRAVDLVVALLLIVILSPLMAVIAALIKLTSRGPVLYVQERVGHNGQIFYFYKFRSMVVGADESGHRDVMAKIIGDNKPVEQDGQAPVFKLKDDPRITRVGRLIRRFSIDELPQLFNVLMGDMSLIGPRPPIPYEVAMYRERHRRRLDAQPGITGLWQVSGRNRLSFEEMVTLDIHYIENWSLGLDIRIAFKTIWAVIFSRGY
jgi:exopolysaccharide biosynthesis polyprenyl glycosylphosphotransferase